MRRGGSGMASNSLRARDSVQLVVLKGSVSLLGAVMNGPTSTSVVFRLLYQWSAVCRLLGINCDLSRRHLAAVSN